MREREREKERMRERARERENERENEREVGRRDYKWSHSKEERIIRDTGTSVSILDL